MPFLWSSRRTDEYLLLFEGLSFIFLPGDNSYLYQFHVMTIPCIL